MREEYLQLKGLGVGYKGKLLIDGIELEVRGGQVLTLIGPNGSGKSTLLKTITSQLKSLAGAVYLKGQDLRQLSTADTARSMAMVMTEGIRAEYMTCHEVAAMGRYPYVGRLGILDQANRQKVDEALRLVHAEDVADRSFNEISDGQRQRVMLARAICQEPEVLVLDEPTSYLDMKYKLDILSSIRKLATDRQVAVIMSLHELELAMKVSDLVACVDGKRISVVGTPESVFTGKRIQDLYGVEAESFSSRTGSIYMKGSQAEPQVFVIGGGGSGLMTYNRLIREGIPFAAGILMANDIEAEAARAGASELVITEAFCPPSSEDVERAKRLIDRCRECICSLETFGPFNKASRELRDYADRSGKLINNKDSR